MGDLSSRNELVAAILGDIKSLGHTLYFHHRGVSGQPQILCELYDHGGQLTQRDLGKRFQITPGSLSEVLTRMEHGELICRTRDPEDSRKLIVKLTERGAHAAAEEIKKRDAFGAWCLSCLSDQEQRELRDLLDRVRAHWNDVEAKESDD